ncbi:MAG: transposase [Clostridia bacterium]|nr:transposase [Clostridia bacterium]
MSKILFRDEETDFPKRKATRLKGFDYSAPGTYFVTICTNNRKCLLSNIVGEGLCALPKNTLTAIGKEVEKTIQFINEHYVGVNIDKYVIMPNHVHLIVALDNSRGHGNPPLQKVIGQLKSYIAHKFGVCLWQRSFHDHMIRGEQDYLKIWNYIDTNAIKWEQDCFYSNEKE